MIMTKHLPLIVLTALALAGCGGSDKTSADKALKPIIKRY